MSSNFNRNNKVILLYYPSLRSYMIHSEVLNNYSEMYECVIEMPAIPYSRKSKKRNWLSIFKILKNAPNYFIMTFVTVKVFSFVSRLFHKSIKHICNNNKIEHHYFDQFDEEMINFIRTREPSWIISSSSSLLPRDLIVLAKCGVLNMHEAPLPKYRGSAAYFWFFVNEEELAHVTAHYLVEALDAGDIITTGLDVKVSDADTVFSLWKKMLLSYDSVWEFMIPFLISGTVAPAQEQLGSFREYSHPTKEGMSVLKVKGVRFMNLHDLFYVLNVAVSGDLHKISTI